MRSEEKALKHAINKSLRSHAVPYYVVYSPNEYDEPGNDYHVANDYELDTYFAGSQILHCSEDYI